MIKTRHYGLDLFRIVSMLGIVALHVLGQGGILAGCEPGTVNYYIAWFLESAFYCSVNAFAILSGYLYAKSVKVKYASILNLIAIVFIYCLFILLAFQIFYPQYLTSIKTYLFALFPPLIDRYWYIVCYVFLFVMIPYINAALRHLSKKQFERFILLCFLLLSLIPTLTATDLFRVNGGYSPFWLIFCYIIGAYIKSHGYPKVLPWFAALLIFIANTVLLLAFKETIAVLTTNILGKPRYINILLNYTSPLVLANAVLLFYIFYHVNIQKQLIRKLIMSLSSAAFAVYIIHSNVLIFDHLLNNGFAFAVNHNTVITLLIIFGGIIVIYLVCWMIDAVRKYIFKVTKLDALCNNLGQELDGFFQKDF